MLIYVALGSNQGDRRGNIERALAALAGVGIHVRRVSSIQRTEPVGMAARAWFLNAVAEAETALLPGVLLRRLLRLEAALGRHRRGVGRRPQPRQIDLDLLSYGRATIHTATLRTPHPRLARRGFVLCGLVELNAGWRAPHSAQSARILSRRA